MADGAELSAGGECRPEGAGAAGSGDAGAGVWRGGAVDYSRDWRRQALAAGYSVVDQTTVIGTHLGELIRRHAQELLGRQEVKRLLDRMKESHPKLVEELVPKLMTLGRGAEGPAAVAAGAGVDSRHGSDSRGVGGGGAAVEEMLCTWWRAVRQSLGRGLVHPLLDGEGGLRVLVLASVLETELWVRSIRRERGLLLGDGARPVGAPADFLRRIVESVKRLTGGGPTSALPVLLCPSPARYHVRRWLEPFLPKVTVLAPAEIPPEMRVRSVGTVG